MVKEVINPQLGERIINSDGTVTIPFNTYLELVARFSEPLEGSGSPEGVVPASRKMMYMDTAAAAGSVLYIKQLDNIGGDRSQGWVLV